MKRKIVEDVLLVRARTPSAGHYSWKEITEILEANDIVLQDDDILTHTYTEGWDYSDSARDPMIDLKVIRPRLENDVEYKERTERWKYLKEKSLRHSYKTYLELKEKYESGAFKEFEDEGI